MESIYIYSGPNIEKYDIETGFRVAAYMPRENAYLYNRCTVSNDVTSIDIECVTGCILVTMNNNPNIIVLSSRLDKLYEISVCDAHNATDGKVYARFLGNDERIFVAVGKSHACKECMESPSVCKIIKYSNGEVIKSLSQLVCSPASISQNRKYIVYCERYPVRTYIGRPTEMENNNGMFNICIYNCERDEVTKKCGIFLHDVPISTITINDQGTSVLCFCERIMEFRFDEE